MATAVSTQGKYELFHYGWTTRVAWAKLYTNLDVLVDTQTITLTFASDQMQVSADIVFAVAAGTNDVAYVTLGYTTGTPLDIVLYTKDLALLYDFATAGTLTIDSFNISVTGTSLQADGRELLCTDGWDTNVTTAKLYTSADALLDTQTVTLATTVGTGICSPTADIVFDVASGTAYYITLSYTPVSTEIVLYKRILDASYAFTTPGTLTVDTWSITV